jgi:hypothetical protein
VSAGRYRRDDEAARVWKGGYRPYRSLTPASTVAGHMPPAAITHGGPAP